MINETEAFPHYEDIEPITCIRCSNPIESLEGEITGIYAECWTVDGEKDGPVLP